MATRTLRDSLGYLIAAQDASNSRAFDELREQLTAAACRASRSIAAEHERQAREVIIRRLPRTGPWLVDHPRALKLLFTVRPRLRPTLTIRWPNPVGKVEY